MYKLIFAWFLLSLSLILQFPHEPWAQEGDAPYQAGPAFVEASENHGIVPPDWVKKGIVYPKGIGKADLVVSLDQHLHPAMAAIIGQFGRSKGFKIVLREGTCGVSSGMLAQKSVDVAGFCCPPAPTDRLPGLAFHTIGVVPNVLMTHPNNPITNLSMAEVRALFAGETVRWDALSDAAANAYPYAVHPISRLHCKTRPGHWRYLLDTEDMFSPKIHNVSSIPDMLEQVTADPFSVGWIARWFLSSAKNQNRVKMLRINGVSPDEPNAVATGRYRFYKVLNITTWHGVAANPIAKELLKYILSHLKEMPASAHIVGVDRLRAAGWRFHNNELVGEPGP